MMSVIDVIKSGDYLILDTETTGLGVTAEICQIAIINSKGETLLDTLVKPVTPIPSEATAIHGISNEAVLETPYFIEVANKILELITGKHVIIYNVEYDTRLLYQSTGYPQIDWHKDTTFWCAMLAFAEIYGDYNSYRQSYRWKTLNVACNYYKVENDNAHSALSDCKATLAICKAMAASGRGNMSELAGMINQYICNKCSGEITTVNDVDGTTPAMLACRVTEGCDGSMFSQHYLVDQGLMADYEWYKPAKLPKGVMREHVQMGGLLLRKL